MDANFTRRFPGAIEITMDHLRTADQPIVTVLFGPSGAGKSTVLRCIAGLEQPDAGWICYGEKVWSEAVTHYSLSPRHRGVGFVPQDFALFPHLTVERNIAYGLHGLSASTRRARLAETLNWLGLEALAGRLPNQLSGGQQQRVALGRAVAHRPKLLLLDEPLSALDAPTRAQLRGDLRRLLVQLRLPTLLVTHDRLEAIALGDELVVLDRGRNLQQGPVAEVFSRPVNLAVAATVGVESVHPGRITSTADGLVTISVGTATVTAAGQPLPPETRNVHVCIRAEDVALSTSETGHSSPRNQLDGTVLRLLPEGPMVRVELDCGFPLVALLTKPGCADLALQPGSQVRALVKAPHIHVIPR